MESGVRRSIMGELTSGPTMFPLGVSTEGERTKLTSELARITCGRDCESRVTSSK